MLAGVLAISIADPGVQLTVCVQQREVFVGSNDCSLVLLSETKDLCEEPVSCMVNAG